MIEMQANFQAVAPSPMAQKIYTAREAAKLFSVSLATWNRYVAAGLVPRPIQLGPRRIGWLEAELVAVQQGWLKRRDGTART